MSEILSLLDTPKRQSLQLQSASLRTSLKDFERAFASLHSGRKPTKDEIRANEEIALQYKTYNRVRDVLAGRVGYDEYVAPVRSPVARRSHRRNDSTTKRTLRRSQDHGTPQKTLSSAQLDSQEISDFISPQRIVLSAIGPTPQRDGKVLGLFDAVSASASRITSQTPSSVSRKRKLDLLAEESPRKTSSPTLMHTPSQKRTVSQGDLLEFLGGTPRTTPQTGRCKRSRTPLSDGRKFMLSQFFATPCSTKYIYTGENDHNTVQTPLNGRIRGTSPADKENIQAGDVTPAYLKRSVSFKDRLLSASSHAAADGSEMLGSNILSGPPTLRHFRAAAKPRRNIVPDLCENVADDHDDDLEALREMESSEMNTVAQSGTASAPAAGLTSHMNSSDNPPTIWKKKGQKRTTRRSNMRPTVAQVEAAPRFVAPENWDEHDNPSDCDQNSVSDMSDRAEDSYKGHRDGVEDALRSSQADMLSKLKKNAFKGQTGSEKHNKKASGTINPNATSHMNFRTLKIRNKNSKAKGGGKGRFGRRR